MKSPLIDLKHLEVGPGWNHRSFHIILKGRKNKYNERCHYGLLFCYARNYQLGIEVSNAYRWTHWSFWIHLLVVHIEVYIQDTAESMYL